MTQEIEVNRFEIYTDVKSFFLKKRGDKRERQRL